MSNSVYKKIEKVKDFKTQNIYAQVKIEGVERYVLLKDLLTSEGAGVFELNTMAEFKRAKKQNKLYIKSTSGKAYQQVVFLSDDLYEESVAPSVSSPERYISSLNIQGDVEIPYGYKRLVRFAENGIVAKELNNALKNGEYLRVHVEGDTQPKYFNKDEIVFGFTTRETLGNKTLKRIDDILSSGSDIIESIYGDKIVSIDLTTAYKFENVTHGKDDEMKPVRESYEAHVLHTFDLGMNGDVRYFDLNVEDTYTEQKYMMQDTTPIVRISNYASYQDNRGDFVKIVLANDTAETLVEKSNLYLDEKLTKPVTNLEDSMVGKVLYVKTTEGEETVAKATEPLNVTQVNYTYTAKKYFQETENKDDIMSDGTYLKLEDDRFVEENKSIRPICYDYANRGEECDAYLVKVNDVEKGEIAIVVPKEIFSSRSNKNKTNFKYAKYNIDRTKAFGLKKSSKSMKECAVIQTSTEQDDFQTCEMLKNPQSYTATGEIIETHNGLDGNAIDVENIIKDVSEKFLQEYKEGKYRVEFILDEKGKPVLVIQGKRFIVKDHIDMPDYSNAYETYAFTKKDGKYDLAKGFKKAYASWGKNALTTSLFAFGVGWPFLAVSPILAGIFVGALGLSALLVPFAQMIKAINHNSKIKLPKDKTKCENKTNKKQIYKELKEEYNRVVRLSKGKNITKEQELRFIAKMDNLQMRAYQLGGGKVMADFAVRKGVKDDVNSANFSAYKEYVVEMGKEEKELNKMLRLVKKSKMTREEYEEKYNEHQRHLYEYVAKGIIVPSDKKHKAVLEAINKTKGFVLAKYGECHETGTKKANLKEKLAKKELKIKRNFSVSLTKTEKKDQQALFTNLVEVANERPFIFRDHIVQSCHAGMQDLEAVVVEETVVRTEIEHEEENTLDAAARTKKTNKTTKPKTQYDDLTFDIFTTTEKGTLYTDPKIPGAVIERNLKTIKHVVEEDFNKESLINVGIAIKCLKEDENLTKVQVKDLKKYIQTNLTKFAEEARTDEFKAKKKGNEELQNITKDLKKLGQQYKDFINPTVGVSR